jgi:hypothetical protein
VRYTPPKLAQRNRPGWGRHPSEDIFHTVPPSHGGPHRKRAVFRLWPRDPKGKPFMPGKKPKGTLSPDGYPWGATLYDIYSVNRLPEVPGMVSTMTGSAICEAMEELGELDVAAPEIEWAKSEGKPRVEGAADTEELIRCTDTRLQVSPSFGVSSEAPKGKQDEEAKDGSEVQRDDKECIYIPSPTMPVTSPFHPSHYPKPWPLIPFENSLSTILLQERIPLYLLPQTLYVHDRFRLLPADDPWFENTSWTSRPDVVRTYDLGLSQSVLQEVKDARRNAEELEEFKARTLILLRYTRTKEQIKHNEPVIEVPLPPYPRRVTTIEESHLYLSPVAKVGNGHHSIVYKAEWALPRELFMKQRICSLCFKESADKEVQRLKDTGRWTKLLNAAAWGPNGFTGRHPTKAELADVCDPVNLKRDDEIIEREITCIVPPGAAPSQIVELLDEGGIWDKFRLMKQTESSGKGINAMQLQFTEDEEDESTKDAYVAVIRIDPPFSYESQKTCTHKSQAPVPRTATFTVVAKLSIEHDHHLVREATNYQKFPEHFFHHYNGYSIIGQLHTIVPTSAIVPQFYGYYTPRKDTEGTSNQPRYLSPILLLEHCGEPIDPEELSVEDQEECASLLLRFQRAGWLHESFAPRNFLVQLGKPTEFPLVRQIKPEPSFRLIDFGRSRKYENADEKRAEEMEALRMLQKLNGQMGVTFSI